MRNKALNIQKELYLKHKPVFLFRVSILLYPAVVFEGNDILKKLISVTNGFLFLFCLPKPHFLIIIFHQTFKITICVRLE